MKKLFVFIVIIVLTIIYFYTKKYDTKDDVNSTIVNSETGEFYLSLELPLSPEPLGDEYGVIAILDSGIAKEHPQLKGRVVKEVDFTGEGTYDYNGHGTRMALIALTPEIEVKKFLKDEDKLKFLKGRIALANVKVANKYGEIELDNLIKGIKWVAKNNIKFISMSIALEGSYEEYKPLCDLISSYKDIFFGVSAGNFGVEAIDIYPANCPDSKSMMVVGGYNQFTQEFDKISGKADYLAPSIQRIGTKTAWYAENYYEEAQIEAQKGNYVKAKELYLKSLEYIRLPKTLFQLASIDTIEKNYSDAIKKLDESVKLSNKIFPEALSQKGAIYLLKQNYNEAIKYLKVAIKQFEDRNLNIDKEFLARTHYNLGIAYLEIYQYSGALKEFKKTLNTKSYELKSKDFINILENRLKEGVFK